MTFHVVTAVWGDAFIDLFVMTAIPNQLSAGNLASLPPGSRYRVFTAADDRARLERAVSPLRAVLPVDVIVMDADEGDRNKYDQMTRYHRRATEDALRDGATLFFLAPDHVLGAGSMARLVHLRAQGYRAAVSAALRLSKESMTAALASRDSADIPPRELVRLALDHLHPVTLGHMVDAPLPRFPTAIYWRTDDGLLVRSLNLHPVMIDPVRPELPKNAIDGRYVWRAVPDLTMVHVISDSDELAIFELTTTRDIRTVEGRRSWSKAWRMASVAFRCDPHQLAYWQRSIRLHAGELNGDWASVERDAARFVRRVLWYRSYARSLFPLLNGIRRWQQKQDRRAREWRRRHPRINGMRRRVRQALRLAA